MTVNKELFKGKRLADGCHPVMIRVFDKGHIKRISTGVRVSVRCWDNLKKRVTHRDREFREKNEIIDSLFLKVMTKPYKWLPESTPEYSANCSFRFLIDKKIGSLSRLNTRRGYECFRRWIEKFDKALTTKDISQRLVDRIARTLEEDKSKTNVMRNLYMNWFRGVCSFGRKEGYISENINLSFPHYPHSSLKRDLADLQLQQIAKTVWNYVNDDPELSKRPTVALSIFLLDILLQGPAPVDLANIRIGQFKKVRLQMHDGFLFEGWSLKLSRQKTGISYTVMVEKTMADIFLTPLFRGKSIDDYLIPCFNADENLTETQRQNRLANKFHSFVVSLNHILKKHAITADSENVTYYHARHAYCNILDRLDIPPHIIRRMIGHKPGVLERHYLQGMTPPDHAYIARELANRLKTWMGVSE